MVRGSDLVMIEELRARIAQSRSHIGQLQEFRPLTTGKTVPWFVIVQAFLCDVA